MMRILKQRGEGDNIQQTTRDEYIRSASVRRMLFGTWPAIFQTRAVPACFEHRVYIRFPLPAAFCSELVSGATCVPSVEAQAGCTVLVRGTWDVYGHVK